MDINQLQQVLDVYMNKLINAIAGNINSGDSPIICASVIKTLLAEGDNGTTTVILYSDFTPALEKLPRIVQIFNSTGIEIQGLEVTIIATEGGYNIIVGQDSDGHTNAVINVVAY